MSFEMGQAAQIDLQTGPDRFCHAAIWVLWLIAAAVAIALMNVLAWPVSAAVCGLLVLSWPRRKRPIERSGRLRLYRNGAALLDEQPGSWGRYFRCSRWYVILLVELPQSKERVLVSTCRNHVDDYRRLLLWTRFPPVGQVNGTRRQL